MLWTIFEILAYMIAAAVLGVILGWVLRGALGSEQAEVSSLRAQLRKLKRAQREAKKAQASAEKAAEAPKEIKAKAEAKPKAKPKATPDRKGTKPSKAERAADQKSAAKAMVDIVGRVGKGETNDDLTKIYGIGPKFSSMLNKMDITSYTQIAKFTKDDIRVVSSALGSFSDRIERDDWVAGAKKVMKELKK